MKFIYFIFFAVLYFGIRLLEYIEQVPFTWMTNYLSDLCAMPLVLGLLLFVANKIKKNQHSLPLWFILLITAYWTAYFEYYLPTTSTFYTGDWLDGLMYFIGAISFWFWQLKYQTLSETNRQIQQT